MAVCSSIPVCSIAYYRLLLKLVHGTGSLIATTVATCFSMNVLTSDQYMSIVLPGRMFKLEYERRQLAPENLSRTLEDSGTLTSPLIPWNTCGAYMAGTMDVATLAYGLMPFLTGLIPLWRSLWPIRVSVFANWRRPIGPKKISLLKANRTDNLVWSLRAN
jgi:Na+/H+ antiporter NhaC